MIWLMCSKKTALCRTQIRRQHRSHGTGLKLHHTAVLFTICALTRSQTPWRQIPCLFQVHEKCSVCYMELYINTNAQNLCNNLLGRYNAHFIVEKNWWLERAMCYVPSTVLRILHTQCMLKCKSSQQSYGVYAILSLLTDEAVGTEKLCNKL